MLDDQSPDSGQVEVRDVVLGEGFVLTRLERLHHQVVVFKFFVEPLQQGGVDVFSFGLHSIGPGGHEAG